MSESENPYEMRLLEERLAFAEKQARMHARVADQITQRFAVALNALKPYEPKIVAHLSGIPEAPAKAEETTGAEGLKVMFTPEGGGPAIELQAVANGEAK